MKFGVSPSLRAAPITPHSPQYVSYLHSAAWGVKRDQVLIRASHRCEHCKREGVPLQVHHLHYRSLGKEKLSDLSALCLECHTAADFLRKQWNKT